MCFQKGYIIAALGIFILCMFTIATLTGAPLDFMGELTPDSYTVEFSLSPGESDSKKLTFTNGRDSPVYNISHTPVSGDATEMIGIEPELIEEIEAGEEDKFVINASVPEDQELGNYTAYSYFLFPLEGFPPSMPIKINFIITVAPKIVEIHGVDLKIDGKEDVAIMNVTSNETASYKLTVKNTGMYFDVLQIEEPEFEAGEYWAVKLYDNNKEVTAFPCDVQLNAGKEHDLMLNVSGTMPGTNLTVEITGRSCANITKMDSVRAISYITGKIEEAVNETTNATKDEP
jgi:uncharacterized membrane protein